MGPTTGERRTSRRKVLNTPRMLVSVAFVVALVMATAMPAGATTTWYTGMRAFGKVTVEPAINDANGKQVFLLTPDKAPFPSKAGPVAQAPLYLVAYPATSTITDPLNCTPTTCDHAQSIPGYPDGGAELGHDHLVGLANTGGWWNVAWDVELDVFTPQGFQDGAINTRIMTLDALNQAKTAGDVMGIDIGVVFNCSAVSAATYARATPLNFTVPPPGP